MGDADYCIENPSYHIHQVKTHLLAPSLDPILESPFWGWDPDQGKSLGNSNASEAFVLSARNRRDKVPFAPGYISLSPKKPCDGQEFSHPELKHLGSGHV